MPRNWLAIPLLLCSILLLSACNSDSESSTSSSGSSTPPTGTTPPPESPDQFAGTYVGSGTATATALGISETETAPVTIIIDKAGMVTIQSGSDIFSNVTVLNTNAFSYTQSLDGQDLGSATCTGALTINGAISKGVINGTLGSSNVVCNGVPVTVTGSLKAIRQ